MHAFGLLELLAVRVLEGDLAVAEIEGVSWEAGSARSISEVGTLAKGVEWLAFCGGLVVEVASEAASANSACVEASTEGVLSSA